MSVVIETTLGDITVDLYLNERPSACLNFIKLCKIKYYNYNLFHTISRGFIAQTGDPTGSRTGGESIYGVIDGPSKRYFEAENEPRIKHTRPGLISFVGGEDNMIGSQFFLTLGEDLTYLDEKHCVFGEVVEGFDTLEAINEVICDNDDKPYQDVRITHTVILDDPLPDPKRLRVPSRSPSPSAERLAGGRIAPDEEIDETSGKSAQEIAEMQAEREAKARATILEMVGDLPDADMAPPENVLFVCKLNPVTTDDDLEIIFSRFGKIKSCEVIRDRKSGDSLQYAFIEFEEQKSCEDAYFKMANVLIDDRRIHVDFSQSVSKVKWLGKGRGVAHYDEKGNKRKGDTNNDVGKGNYKVKNGAREDFGDRRNRRDESGLRKKEKSPEREKERNGHSRRSSRSPRRRSRSPIRKRSRSPQRSSRYSRSLDRYNRRESSTCSKKKTSRSPQKYRRYSRSPKRDRKQSESPRRSSNRNHSDSNRQSSRRKSKSPRRNRSSVSPKGQRDSRGRYNDLRRNQRTSQETFSRKENARVSTRRSRSLDGYSSTSRSRTPKTLSEGRYRRDPRGRSSSRSKRSSKELKESRKELVSPIDRHIKKQESSRRSRSPTNKARKKSDFSTKCSDSDTKQVKQSDKRNKSDSKKKSRRESSSEDSESEDEKPKKKSKKKKKAESSSDDEISSEEERKKKSSKNKRKKTKKGRKKYVSSSGSSSESSTSSSSSDSDRAKQKRKKKRTKSSSVSD